MSLRVLIVKTSSMGDILHTFPALTDAAKQIPGIKFDWIVEENFSQIPRWHFAVDKVIPVAIRRWRKNWFSKKNKQERKAFIEKLRQQQYDYVIDAQGLLKSALIVRHTIGEKHGYDRHSIKEPLASFFYDVKHNIHKELHAVERIRLLFSLSLKYWVDDESGDYAIEQHFFKKQDSHEKKSLIFLHATTRKSKHWTEKQWHKLIELIDPNEYDIKLPWGTPKEFKQANRIAKKHDNVIVLPKLSLEDIAGEITKATAVVSVDTGLSHLTTALSRPNITLYGETDPFLIGGYGIRHTQIISLNKKMSAIKAEKVFNALKKYL